MSCGCGNNNCDCQNGIQSENGNCSRGGNPCRTCPTSTVDCETLPSALDNFTRQFFGIVTKTEVNGQISWVLPCDLDVGLPANPREDGEGLACYFLRLLGGEIQGLTGPKGDTGFSGTPGQNAYAIITSAFVTPTPAQPISQFTIIPTVVLSVGQTVFIPGLGWVTVQDISQSQTVITTLVELISNPAAVINPGTPALPVGPRGLTIVGPQGAKGEKGDVGNQGATGATGATGAQGEVGPAGAVATNTNGTKTAGTTDYQMTLTFGNVDFGTEDLDVTLATAGTYLFCVRIAGTNQSGGDREWGFKLYNQNTATDVPESECYEIIADAIAEQTYCFSVLVTTTVDNQVIQLWTKTGAAGSGLASQILSYALSSIAYVKLST